MADYSATVLSNTDYYPFGMEMEGRSFNAGNYRYGYQGEYAEKDPESGFNSFQLRQYDPRLGRWMKTAPYYQYHSPYMAMGNNPVSTVDPAGGQAYNTLSEYDSNFNQFLTEGGTYTQYISMIENGGANFLDYVAGIRKNGEFSSVEYSLFVNDGFWDVDFIDENTLGLIGIDIFQPDGLGPSLERFDGIPYEYVPAKATSDFINSGY